MKKSAASKKPFFQYLAYNAPHSPIQPPEDWLRSYRTRHPDVPEKRARNAAFVEHLDDRIGKVLATLEQTGRADDTLVIFTSDNGGALPHAQSNGSLAGSKQEKAILELLSQPVTWAAPHIAGDGKRTWVDVATEEMES